MKIIVSFLLWFWVLNNISAQDLTLEPGSFSFEFGENEGSKQIGYILTNTTADVLEWTWTVEKSEDFPEGWDIQVCDQIACWAPNAFSMPNTASGANTLAAGSSTAPLDNYIKILSNGIAGTGEVKFTIYNNFDFDTELISSSISTSTNEINTQNISIYPNPTQDYFQVSADNKISQIEVYNIVGKKIRSFGHNQNTTYDISDLRNGLYVVRLLGTDGKQVKSMRLSKR